MISKSLSTSRKFAELGAIAGPMAEFCQLLFPLLVSHADDYGRLSGDAFTIKFQVFPISPRSVEDFQTAIDHIANAGLIDVYDWDGDKFIQITKFDEHQTGLHKRSASKIPEPPGNSRKFPEIPGQQNRRELKRREEKGTEGKGEPHTDAERAGTFSEWYSSKHSELFGVGYIGNPRKDYESALTMVAKFTDAELRDAALVWFGMDDDFATSGTRTIPKFASRVSKCVELARRVAS